ncbi:MAG: Hpt domain-containing protein [Candidatus Ozemobacteraceae bacterium]
MNDQQTPVSEAIDPEVLGQLKELQRMSNPRLLRELYGIYVKNALVKRNLLREAVANGDSKAIFIHAHSLKSSSGNIGALVLSKLVSEIESLGRNNEGSKAGEKYPPFDTEFERVLLAIEAILVNEPT